MADRSRPSTWVFVLGVAALGLTALALRRRDGDEAESPSQRIEWALQLPIAAPPSLVHAFWSQPDRLPLVLRYLQAVTPLAATDEWRWVFRGSLGATIDTRCTRRLSSEPMLEVLWETVEGVLQGHCRITCAAERGATLMSVEGAYTSSNNALRLDDIFGRDPESRLREDLERLRSVLERRVTAS